MTTITNTHSGIDHLSYSAVSTFQRCPLKWHFRYVDKLPDESIGSALAFGSAIHAGLECHFRQLLESGTRAELADLILAYDDCWQSYDTELLKYGRGEDAESLRELGEKMFIAFQEHDFSSTDGTIVGIEEPLRAEFIPGMPDLVARVDLAVQTGDELVVTDFKTSRSRWNPGQVAFQAEQLLLYSDLAGKVLGDRKIRLQFAVITKAKTPVLELHEVELDEARLDRTRAVFSQVWDAIQSGIVYPAPSQMNCWGCGYKKACQQWQG